MNSCKAAAMSEPRKPFLPLEDRLPVLAGGGWHAVARRAVESLMGLPEVRRRSDLLGEQVARGAPGFETFFDIMGFQLDAPGAAESVPADGPLLVIANHPLGGPEALAVSIIARRARCDVKVLGNVEALGLPGIRETILPLEILGGEGAARKNLRVLKGALEHLRAGGALVVFPGGAVSHWQWESARVEDPPWSLHTARLVRKSGARVLPVRVFGQNGPLFQIIGSLHPLLRSALLLRAFLAMRGRAVRCRAGRLLDSADLPRDPESMTAALRAAVYGVSP